VDWGAVKARYGHGPGAAAIHRSLALVDAVRREADGAPAPGREADLLGPGAAHATERAAAGMHSMFRTLRAPGGFRAIFPSRRYMEARFGLRSGSPLLPLLYPWRLLAGAARRLRGR
jgi:hypothetical protein